MADRMRVRGVLLALSLALAAGMAPGASQAAAPIDEDGADRRGARHPVGCGLRPRRADVRDRAPGQDPRVFQRRHRRQAPQDHLGPIDPRRGRVGPDGYRGRHRLRVESVRLRLCVAPDVGRVVQPGAPLSRRLERQLGWPHRDPERHGGELDPQRLCAGDGSLREAVGEHGRCRGSSPAPRLATASTERFCGSTATEACPRTIRSSAGTRNAVYSMGHRNVQGIAIRPGTDQVYVSEHGPDVNDEINLLVPGGNYGWPCYTGAATPN